MMSSTAASASSSVGKFNSLPAAKCALVLLRSLVMVWSTLPPSSTEPHCLRIKLQIPQQDMERLLTQEPQKKRKRIQIFKYYVDSLIHNGMWSEGFCFPLYSFSKKILSTRHESLGESKK